MAETTEQRVGAVFLALAGISLMSIIVTGPIGLIFAFVFGLFGLALELE